MTLVAADECANEKIMRIAVSKIPTSLDFPLQSDQP
jgi:hypothetical protein